MSDNRQPFKPGYDEFLGHPDFIADAKLEEEMAATEMAGTEGMHDVVKYANRLEADAQASQATAPQRKPTARKGAEGAPAPHEVLRVHPDFTESGKNDGFRHDASHEYDAFKDGEGID